MWHGVPFACQRCPIIGVLRMCWLLPGSFDCFCCPHTSVHRPSIACLAVFLCGPGALFLHALSGPSTICPFPPHGWSAPDGLPLLLRPPLPLWSPYPSTEGTGKVFVSLNPLEPKAPKENFASNSGRGGGGGLKGGRGGSREGGGGAPPTVVSRSNTSLPPPPPSHRGRLCASGSKPNLATTTAL